MKEKNLLGLITRMFRYYGAEINETNIEIYMEFLADYNIKLVERAFNYFIEESKFMPKVSEILEYIRPRLELYKEWDNYKPIKFIENKEE